MPHHQVRSVLDEADRVLAYVVPRPLRVPLHGLALNVARRGERQMLRRLEDLCPRTGRALDVGANHGLYTNALVRRIPFVDAFEPQAECACNLRAFASVFARNLTVHQVALSDREGSATLNVPWFHGRLGRATLSGQATLEASVEQCDAVAVERKTLDSYAYDDVSFVKIDVEGHEDRVFAGATATIAHCRPIVLVEIEQRHLGDVPIQSVFTRVESMGYYGEFYREGLLCTIDTFDVSADQLDLLDSIDEAISVERYVNMFVFRPSRS